MTDAPETDEEAVEPIVDVNEEGVKPVKAKSKAKKPVVSQRFRCGLSADRVRVIIAAEEQNRRGWMDFPWSDELKDKMLISVADCASDMELRKTIQELARVDRGGDGRA